MVPAHLGQWARIVGAMRSFTNEKPLVKVFGMQQGSGRWAAGVAAAGSLILAALVGSTQSAAAQPESVAASVQAVDAFARAGVLHGRVISGAGRTARPLAGTDVALFESGAAGARQVASARADSAGRFLLRSPSGSAHRYIVATTPRDQVLVALLGDRTAGQVTVNEMTTVAAAYTTLQLARGTEISGTRLQLNAASGMAANLVSAATGLPSMVIRSSPNGNETNTWRSLGSLANLLVPCVRETTGVRACTDLLAATKAGADGSTWTAIQQVAGNPARNVKGVFALSNRSHSFTPYLTSRFGPSASSKWTRLDAFTLAVKVNATGRSANGKELCPFGGPGNLVFDESGYAWITNNVVQGTPNSTNCIIVLRPDGTPARGEEGHPSSPVTGGGIIGQGFGIGFAPTGYLWSGNFGWGSAESMPTTDGTTPGGSVSIFDPLGNPLTGPYGISSSLNRVQGTVSDARGNVWAAGYGNSVVQVFPGGDPSAPYPAYSDTNTEPFDIRLDSNGDAWVSYTGTSTASKLRFTPSGVQKLFTVSVGTAGNPKGVAIDQAGNAWVASGAQNAVFAYGPDGTPLGSFSGGGMNGPWGVTVDSSGSLWAANFGGVTQVDTKYGVTHLCGFTESSCPSGLKPGDALTPQTGFTLPSGGAPVRLHSGELLYGPKGPKTLKPLMRETAAEVDAAGNLWVTNNWKPSGAIDTAGGNPGGDGIVVFLGVASPVQPKPYNAPASAPGD